MSEENEKYNYTQQQINRSHSRFTQTRSKAIANYRRYNC